MAVGHSVSLQDWLSRQNTSKLDEYYGSVDPYGQDKYYAAGNTDPNGWYDWRYQQQYGGMSNQDAFNKWLSTVGGATNTSAKLNPDGTVSYNSYDDEFDPGLAIMGGLAAGVGGLSGGFGLGELINGASSGGTGAFDMGGVGTGVDGVAGGGALGAGGAFDMSGFDPSTYTSPGGGWDYNQFLQDIGIDPTSTQFSGGTMSNADIMQSLNLPSSFTIDPTKMGSLARILSGNGTADDYLKVGGQIGSTLLGVYGSNQNADAIRDLYNTSRNDRKPFLDTATSWLNDPNAYFAGPGKAAMDGVLRGLSVNGNPFGSGHALEFATEAGLRNWQNAVTGMGNLGLAGEDTRANLGLAAAGADSNMFNALGSGLSSLTNPSPSLTDLAKLLGLPGLRNSVGSLT